jgi:hypothetical protein
VVGDAPVIMLGWASRVRMIRVEPPGVPASLGGRRRRRRCAPFAISRRTRRGRWKRFHLFEVGEQAPRRARLVGDDEHQTAEAVQTTTGHAPPGIRTPDASRCGIGRAVGDQHAVAY